MTIHHVAMGQADATLVVGTNGATMLVDVGETRWDDDAGALRVGAYVERLCGTRHLDVVVLTHFHLDHTGAPGRGGLWHLVERQGFTVGTLFHRDLRRFVGRASATLDAWRGYLDGDGALWLAPRVARLGRAPIDLGPGVSVRFVAVDGNGRIPPGDHRDGDHPPDEDDLSLAFVLRFGRFDYFAGGDLSGAHTRSRHGFSYHDVERHVAPLVGDVDVYRVNHHGSRYASNATLLAQLAPRAAIVSAGTDNQHGHPHPETVARLARRGPVYGTQRAGEARAGVRALGDVVVWTDGRRYVIGEDTFPATDPVRADRDGDGYFLEADPDDGDATKGPAPEGGCDPVYEPCASN